MTLSGKTAGVPRPAEQTHQGGSARTDNTRSRSRTKKIQHREKVMRSDRIGTRESSKVSPVSRSQGIEENENLEYSFLGFTQEN